MTAAERFVKRMLVGDTGEEKVKETTEIAEVLPQGDASESVSVTEGEGAEQGEKKRRESALDAAIEYLQNPANDNVKPNVFSKKWAVKKETEEGKVKGNKASKTAHDSLYEALVADESPKGKTLAEHDKERHPDGFNPETDTCKFRERLSTETEEDKADELDAGKGEGSDNPSQVSGKKPSVTAEEDAAYMEAVEKGDIKTVKRLFAKAAREFLGDSVVRDSVWHSTKKKFTEFKNEFPHVFFFAKDRKWADRFGKDERYAKEEHTRPFLVDIKNPIDMREYRTGLEWLEFFKDNGVELGENGIRKLQRFGEQKMPGYAILNHDSAEPHGTGYRDAMRDAGFDGAIFEDVARGKTDRTTYGVFDASQIKSADPVTYDDSGNVVPLSRRFDDGDDIRGDVSGSTSSGSDGEEFGESFYAEVYPDRRQSYSSEFGTDEAKETAEAEEAYKANFTRDGQYKMPFEGGKFIRRILDAARGKAN